MRSNVRKMWTALLAVLFAAAVGFGLWFAFAPADRPASVQAVEDGKASLEIGLDANGGTLYSNQDVNRLIGDFFIEGTVHYADGGTDDLLEFQTDGSVSFQVYADYSEGNFGEPCDDLRPNEEKQEGRDGNTYQRWIVASIELDGTPVSSKPLLVNVTRATPSDINVDLSNNVFAALNTIPPENITVEIEYEPGADYTYTVPYGEYTILYGAGPEYHDRLEFGDSEIKISYREYEGQTPLTETKRVRVTEALVVAPTWASYAGTDSPVLPYTGEEQTLSLVGYDQDAMTLSEESGFDTTITDETPEFTMTDAGEYSVTISVNEGYKFRSDIPTYAEPTYDPSDPEKITALTYNWSISPAEIIEVSVAWKWAGGWYYSQEGVEKPKDSDIEEVTIKYGNEEQVTKSPDEVGAKAITFYFSGTANDGTTITDSTDLPTQAGNYTWRVELTGMKNFNDFTGSSGNGGVGSFTIQKKSLTVPELNYLSFTYNKQDQAPAPKVSVTENDPYTFSVTEQKDVGDDYTAAFSLKNTNNYEWASGSSAQIDGATATYTWVIVKASVTVPTLTSKEYNGQPQKADISSDLYTAEQGNNWINAGDYNVTLTLSDSTNYKWKDGTSTQGDNDEKTTVTFIITQKKVEIIWSNTTLTYNGENQAPTATINNKIGNDDVSLSVSGAETNANTDGATYTATASLKGNAKDNYTLDGAENTTCSFTISPYQIGVEGTLSIAMGGWMYGSTPNAPSGMSIASNSQSIATAGGDTLTGEYLYYTSNDSSAQPLSGVPTDAGSYWVRYHAYSDTTNFTEAYSDFVSFTIAKKTIGIKWGTLEFIYNGQPQQPTAKPTGVVDGDTLTLTVSVEGEHTNAGTNYTATAKLEGKDAGNYQLPDKDTTQFTIHKKQISIPELLGDENTPSQREFEHDGNAKSPTINGDWGGATVTQSGYFKSDFSPLESAPVEFGDYFVRLTLSDTQNYKWVIIASDQLPQTGEVKHIDTISAENNEYLYVAFRITGSLYSISVSHEGWTIGNDRVPIPYVTAAKGSEDALNSALDLGVTVTFTYYFVENGTETEVATVTANNGTTTLGFVPVEVALKAGTYKVRVDISASDNQSYAARTALSAEFTVSPYELQKGDVEWTVPENRVYKGAGYTFGAEDTCDIYATYKTWSYANGVYSATENGGYLTLALTGEAGKILNAGDYTLTAELPQGETNVVWGDNASKTHTVTIEKRVVDVTLKEYTVTYNGEAFEPFEAKEGTDYTAAEASVDTVTGLISGDDLQITLTPSSDTDAGSYAWSKITWSNTNYSVNVMNGGEEMFVIDKAPITVKINDQSSVYGENIVSLTVEASKNTETALYTVTGDLYDNADTIFSLSTEQENIFDAGSYKIVGTDSGLQNSGNYDVTFVDAEVSGKNYGTYTITERALTVTVTGTIEYGEEAPTEVLGYAVTLNGALERDEATLKGLLSITAENYSAGDDKGSYTLTVRAMRNKARRGGIMTSPLLRAPSTLRSVRSRSPSKTLQRLTARWES